jgi:hypothetical protein
MSRTIAINGTRLDQMRMLMEPPGNNTIAYLRYLKSQIRFSRDDRTLCVAVPAYLAVELYRIGVLPQDANRPVVISIGGRPAGRYTVSDVRYPQSSFREITFTLTRVVRGEARNAAKASPRSHSAAAGGGTYITDITHYLAENGEVAPMPGPARKLASFLTLLIEAATNVGSAHYHDSGIRCRAEACRGTILTRMPPSRDLICWHCPACGHNGLIRNWHNTKWNQLKRAEQLE